MGEAWLYIRTIVLALGWTALAALSGWMIHIALDFRERVGKRRASGLVVSSMVSWVATSMLLGVTATVFWFIAPWQATWVVVPVFVAWCVSFAVMYRVSRGWAAEANELRTYYRERESIDRLKASIINRFSHAFATPLTPMATSLAVLESDAASLSEKQRHLLQVIARNQERLTEMVHQAVYAGEVHGRRISLHLVECDLASLVHHAIADTTAGERKIRVDGLPSMPVYLDEPRVSYVFERLLSHAVNGPSGTVRVTGQVFRDEVEVRIRYPSEEDPHAVFGLFGTPDTEGMDSQDPLDLGLFTAQGIIELHGGDILAGRDDDDVVVAVRLPTATVQGFDQAASRPTIVNRP